MAYATDSVGMKTVSRQLDHAAVVAPRQLDKHNRIDRIREPRDGSAECIFRR